MNVAILPPDPTDNLIVRTSVLMPDCCFVNRLRHGLPLACLGVKVYYAVSTTGRMKTVSGFYCWPSKLGSVYQYLDTLWNGLNLTQLTVLMCWYGYKKSSQGKHIAYLWRTSTPISQKFNLFIYGYWLCSQRTNKQTNVLAWIWIRMICRSFI